MNRKKWNWTEMHNGNMQQKYNVRKIKNRHIRINQIWGKLMTHIFLPSEKKNKKLNSSALQITLLAHFQNIKLVTSHSLTSTFKVTPASKCCFLMLKLIYCKINLKQAMERNTTVFKHWFIKFKPNVFLHCFHISQASTIFANFLLALIHQFNHH